VNLSARRLRCLIACCWCWKCYWTQANRPWYSRTYNIVGYYAALLPRRGPHIASHSVCPSVCLSVCPSVPLSLPSVTSFRQPLASRMYFSARTEGRISYGHLGRTRFLFNVFSHQLYSRLQRVGLKEAYSPLETCILLMVRTLCTLNCIDYNLASDSRSRRNWKVHGTSR